MQNTNRIFRIHKLNLAIRKTLKAPLEAPLGKGGWGGSIASPTQENPWPPCKARRGESKLLNFSIIDGE
jgi:hypothetical protein